jgi:hypothetical protein
MDSPQAMSPEEASRWLGARTLADLGELTAQWLEGKIASIPTVVPCTGPDKETIPLIPVLAAINRAGYITNFSQPGIAGDGWIQRASVSGFASPVTFAALCGAVAGADLMITAARAGPEDWPTTAPVTLSGGGECTWSGGAMSQDAIEDSYGGGTCHPAAVTALRKAWQVTLTDPEWGRDDVLWPALEDFATFSKCQ